MKRFLYIILFSTLIAGCNNNSATTGESKTPGTEKPAKDVQVKASEVHYDTTGGVNVDTLGMAEFLALKAARLRRLHNTGAKNSTNKNEIDVDTLGFAEYKRMRAKSARQPIEAPTPRQETTTESKKPNNSWNSASSKNETAAQKSVSKVRNKSSDHTQVAAVPADQTKEKKDVKKGVSNKTKGAIIGAVTGAAAGAVINKRNRKAGGIVGGILGAAAGYGIGRQQDKKVTTAKRGKDTTNNKQQY